MNTLKFKTTINCKGCLAKVSPNLDSIESIISWSVDLADPDKILTVESKNTDTNEIIEAVKRVGFAIILISVKP